MPATSRAPDAAARRGCRRRAQGPWDWRRRSAGGLDGVNNFQSLGLFHHM